MKNITEYMHLNNKTVDEGTIEFMDFDYREENAQVERAWFTDGTELTDSELDTLCDKYTCELHAIYMDRLY